MFTIFDQRSKILFIKYHKISIDFINLLKFESNGYNNRYACSLDFEISYT